MLVWLGAHLHGHGDCRARIVVLDCIAHGESGHAARGEGKNAIYLAMKDRMVQKLPL